MLNEQEVAGVCSGTVPAPGDAALLAGLERLVPGLHHVASREGWHRSGGVVAADGTRVAEHLREWVETQSDGDVTDLAAQYADEGYIATRIAGRSLYFVAPDGEGPLDFVQIEVEETREVTDRPLFVEDEIPDDVEDLINPVEVVHVAPEPVGPARYALRRITDFAQASASNTDSVYGDDLFRRFVADWEASSAASERFCDHWVLTLMPYADRFGAHRFDVKPVPAGALGAMPKDSLPRGAELGKLLHQFDRDAGYHMAWYFAMVAGAGVSHRVGEAVYEDLNGAFAYLPAKDLAVLRAWIKAPFRL